MVNRWRTFLGFWTGISLGLGGFAEDLALSPEAERGTFGVDAGLSVEGVAAEPWVRSPAALAWDERGLLHVVENPGYPVGPRPGGVPEGALVRLADRDGDGQVDERVVIADGFHFPNGLMRWRGGWLVTDAPSLWWVSDTNGDGRADVREVWFTGFGTNQTTQLRACYPTLGPDGWIYLARGLTGGLVTSPKWPHLEPVDLKAGDFRFRPDGSRAEAIGGNAQFGLVVDDVGRRFLVSNRNPLMHAVCAPRWWRRHPALPFSEVVQDVSPSGYEAKVFPLSADSTTAGFMPELMAAPHAGTFTAACGIHQHFGDGLPAAYQGDWFICEPAQNLVQRQRAEPDGPTFRSRRQGEGREFLASTDTWFRPVFAATGPDGALYVADLYRKVIDHPEYLPVEVRRRLDFEAGKNLGRVWRVRSAGATGALVQETLADKAVNELIEALSSTNGWVRQTAHRLLLERGAGEYLDALLASLDRTLIGLGAFDVGLERRKTTDPMVGTAWGVVRRLWLLSEALGTEAGRQAAGSDRVKRGWACLLRALWDPSPLVREVGWRIHQARDGEAKHALPDVGYEWVDFWARDPSAAVRFHFALQCGQQEDWTPVVPALVTIARLDGGDRWIRAAVLSGLKGREEAFLRRLLSEPLAEGVGTSALLGDLAWICAADEGLAARRLLLDRILASGNSVPAWGLTALTRLSEGLRSRGRPSLGTWLDEAVRERADAKEWLGGWQVIRARAVEVAGDASAAMERRVAAVRFLGEVGFEASREALAGALKRGQPEAVQLEAVRVVGRFELPEAGKWLATAGAWDDWPSSVRSAAIAVMSERTTLVPSLLELLERGVLPAWVVEPQRRRTLQGHSDPAIRDRARKLFADAGGGDRRKAFEALKPVLVMDASAPRGREVFLKACASCHRSGADGVAVGPDLTGVKNQPAEALLLHIVVPDAEIYPGYQACEVETADGRSLTGLLVSETPQSVVLKRAGGEQETLDRGVIRSLTMSRVSLMPQELERTMSHQEMADLIRYLKSP